MTAGEVLSCEAKGGVEAGVPAPLSHTFPSSFLMLV